MFDVPTHTFQFSTHNKLYSIQNTFADALPNENSNLQDIDHRAVLIERVIFRSINQIKLFH